MYRIIKVIIQTCSHNIYFRFLVIPYIAIEKKFMSQVYCKSIHNYNITAAESKKRWSDPFRNELPKDGVPLCNP